MKKMLALLLTLCLLAGMVPLSAGAEGEPITTFPDLKNAITSAEPGSKISVSGKIDFGNETLTIDKGLTIVGEKDSLLNYSGDANTAALNVTTDEQVNLKNITLTTERRAIALSSNSPHVTLTTCEFLVGERGVSFAQSGNTSNAELVLDNTSIRCSTAKASTDDEYNTKTAIGDYRGISIFNVQNSQIILKNKSELSGFGYAINVSGTNNESGVKDTHGLVVTVEDSLIRSWTAFNVWGSMSTYNVTRSNILGINNSDGSSDGFAAIVFNDDLYDQFEGSHAYKNVLNITDSTIQNYQSGSATEGLVRIDCGVDEVNLQGNVTFKDVTGGRQAVFDISAMNDPLAFVERHATITDGVTVNIPGDNPLWPTFEVKNTFGDGQVSYGESFKDFVSGVDYADAAAKKETVILLANVNEPDFTVNSEAGHGNQYGGWTLDLAGYTLTLNGWEGDKIAVIDSSSDQSGDILVNGESILVARNGEKCYTSLATAITAANAGDTVVLLKDTSISQQQTISKSLTLDLGSHTVSYAGSKNGEKMFFVTQDNSNVSIRNGSLKIGTAIMSAANSAVVVGANNVTFSMDGVTIEGKDANNGPYIGVTVNGTNTDAVVTLTQCSIKNCGIGVYFPPASSTLKLDDCDISSWAAVAVKGGTVEISDSTLIGTEIGYTADQFKNFSPNSGGANTAGEALYLEGNYARDAKVTVTNSKLHSQNNFAIRAQFLGEGEKSITLNSGYYSGAQGVFFEGHADNTNTSYASEAEKAKSVISISGGYFTSDPSDYVATGYYAGESDNPAYAYQVKENENEGSKPAEVVAAEPDVEASGITDEGDAEKVAAALAGTEATLDAAAKEQAAKNTVDTIAAEKALKDASINVDKTDTVTVVVQPYLAMEAKSYDGTNGTMTVDIKAMYRTVATTAKLGGENPDKIIVSGEEEGSETANAVVIGKKENTLPVEGSVKISIPLPANFVTAATKTIYVQHKGYEHEADVTSKAEDGGTTSTATFTNPHGFSTFVFSTETKTVATVNGTNYTNFQQAVNAAGRNGTIEVKEGGQTATGVTYNLTLKNDGTASITVTINGEKITIPANDQVTFTYTAPTTPPRPTEEKHGITISTDGKGQVTGPASAAEDDKVTLTVKPNADKELYDLKVTDEDGKAVTVTKVNDATYTFTMPDGKVTIAATFGCDGGDNCPSKAFIDLGDKQWYHDFIDYAVENGLLEGTSATTMEPNATLIRAQLAQILYNIEDKPAVTGEMVFEDVPASEWFYSPVLWANQNEIINGTSPTTFEPLEAITRQDLALMLYRYAGKPAVTGDLDGFTDGDQVGDWADEAMAWAVAEGIVQGDTPTTLNPTGTATRAEAAAMLQRFLEDAA